MIKLLEGIRVLECAMLPTGEGDYLRELGDRITDQNSVFQLFCNRNKRTVTKVVDPQGLYFSGSIDGPPSTALSEIGYSSDDVAGLRSRVVV